MKIIHNIGTPAHIIDDVQESQQESEKLEKENNDLYRIIGIIDGHYIVQTLKGFKKVKSIETNKKNLSVCISSS